MITIGKDTTLQVPFIDLKAQYRTIQNEIQEAINRILDNTSFILGSEVDAFEKAFASYCETEFAVGTDSGTSAIELILRAYDIGPDDEVITVANTFIATALPISYVGAKPVLVDMDPETFLIDISKIEAAITEKTKAIIPVHLFGHPVDLDPLLEIANRHSLLVIEDACQAHGAKYKGRRVGGLGHAAAFSFYPGKNLGAYGDGGIITTNDEQVAIQLRKLRDYGQSRKYHHDELGYNRRLDAMQAAILNVKLNYLDDWNEARRKHADNYFRLLSDSKVIPPTSDPNVEAVWHLYVIEVEDRDRMQEYLSEKNISTGIHYPIPIHLQKSYQYLGHQKGDFPFTERASDKIVSLPMYAELTPMQIEHVVQAIQNY